MVGDFLWLNECAMSAPGTIRYCEQRIAEIDEAVSQIVKSGAASATISSGGGTKSYTRLSLTELRAERAKWASALARLRSSNGTGIRHIGRVYR